MFSNVKFTSITKPELKAFIRIRRRKGTLVITLNSDATEMMKGVLHNFNGVELLAADRRLFAIKPKLMRRSGSQVNFTCTALSNAIDNLPINKRIEVTLFNGMLVCDLMKK